MAAAASSNKRKHKSRLLNKTFFAAGDSINSIPFGSEIITIQTNLLPLTGFMPVYPHPSSIGLNICLYKGDYPATGIPVKTPKNLD